MSEIYKIDHAISNNKLSTNCQVKNPVLKYIHCDCVVKRLISLKTYQAGKFQLLMINPEELSSIQT